jgi:hypothetical protein
MKASKSQSKPYKIISENPKMDTSGMAGKPMDFSDMVVEYKAPPMPLSMMMGKCKETRAKK